MVTDRSIRSPVMSPAERYPDLWARLLLELRERGMVHGSELREWWVELYRTACDDQCEKLLRHALDVGVAKLGDCFPTSSQRAFVGLQYHKHPGAVPGCFEHFYYTRGPNFI